MALGPVQSMFFLVSVDNDRRSLHPEHLKRDDFNQLSKKEQSGPCRHCEIEKRIHEKLGASCEAWPISGAIAVPVEMLESWLLLICGQAKYGTETKLPVFSNKEKASAIKDYGGKNKVPNQLKDLVELERQSLGHSKREFYQHCASVLEPTDLARKSSSFAQFLNQVNHWARAG